MKRTNLLSLFCLAAMLSFPGCSKNSDGEDGLGKNNQIILPEESMSINMGEAETTSTFTFTAKSAWTASVRAAEIPDSDVRSQHPGGLPDAPLTKAPAPWLKVEPMSGPAGKVTLTIEAPLYFADKERIAELTLKAGPDTKSILVFQWAVPPIILSPLVFQQRSLPGVVWVKVSANTDVYSVRVEEGASWLTQQPGKGDSDRDLYFDVAGNPEPDFRRGVIRITDEGSGLSQTVEVYQGFDSSAEVVIVDNTFRKYVLAAFDSNKDGHLSELEAKEVYEMRWSNLNMSSLGELSLFPNLEFLTVENSSLPSLDLTGNPKLTELTCKNTSVSSIDISHNPLLRDVVCLENPDLVSLTLGDVPELVEIDCRKNPACTKLTFGKAVKLNKIDCSDNALTELDVSGMTELRMLKASNNRLRQLKIGGCRNLYGLSVENNLLASLHCPGLDELKYLTLSKNELISIDVTGCNALTNFDCRGNRLSELFLNSCTSLTDVLADDNLLNLVDVKGCRALHKLTLNNNQLASLDLSGNPLLVVFDCKNNQLTSLDLTGNTSMGWVDCSGNRLTSLLFNAPENLQRVFCSDNALTTLDFGDYTQLVQLWVSNLPLNTLNLSGCLKMWNIELKNTSLKELNLGDSPGIRPENLDLRGTDLLILKYYNELCGKANGWWGEKDPLTGKYPYPVISYTH